MRPIFLIGFMCSGKTTLGRALASRTGMRFIDLDQMIEQEQGMSVKSIFSSLGETEFRRLEADALARVSMMSDVIIACGGGTPCSPGAMELMNGRGITVHLVPDQSRLVRRLMYGRRKRPLLATISTNEEMLDFARRKIAERAPWYDRAQHIFDSTMLETPMEIAITVDEFINEFFNGDTSRATISSQK